jgi:hypothetical protein
MEGMMKQGAICLVIAMCFLQACGMVVHGPRQDLSVQTEPGGVTARIGGQECVTPCTLNNVHRDSRELFLRKGDGREKVYYLSSQRKINVGASICGNILFLDIGLLVDFFSGSAYTIQPVDVRFDDLME